jgi:hypothetical protein
MKFIKCGNSVFSLDKISGYKFVFISSENRNFIKLFLDSGKTKKVSIDENNFRILEQYFNQEPTNPPPPPKSKP